MIPAKNDPISITNARNTRITVSSIFEPEQKKFFFPNLKNLKTIVSDVSTDKCKVFNRTNESRHCFLVCSAVFKTLDVSIF